MSRPAQLQQQIDHVKQLQAELLNPTPPTPPVDEPVPPQEPTEPVVPAVVASPPATTSKEEFDRLEQKYRTLQGMHNADIVRNREQMAQLTATIQNLESRLAAQTAPPTPSAPTKYVTAEDESEYGDTLEMVRRAAREEAESVAHKREDAYVKRIADLEAKLSQVQTVMPIVEDMQHRDVERIKSQFWDTVNSQVPNWRTINDNQAFKDWLVAEDPVTGATRQQFLAEARANYIPSRVVTIFKEWERSQAGGPTPAPSSQTDLQKYVAPGSSRTTAPPDGNNKRKWTKADISQFYSDVLNGKYAGKAEEKNKIEADIYAAQRENRIS